MASFSSIKDLINAYNNGLDGTQFDERKTDEILASMPKPLFSQAASDGIKDSGKGKLALPYKLVQEFDPSYGEDEAQVTGDCQNPTDLVRMADGTEKRMVDIIPGEYVISGTGQKRKVISIVKKPYNKKMVKISVDGHKKTISSTPDHKYLVRNPDSLGFEWKPIISLSEDDHVILGAVKYEEKFTFDMANFCPTEYVDESSDFKKLRLEPCKSGTIRQKGSGFPINRNIELSEKLSWLIGMYAAEGGADGTGKNESNHRITFNLCSDEILFAQKIKEYMMDIFGIDTKIYQVPSKPSVLYARIYSATITSFFKYLCRGNMYNKSLSKEWFITSKSNKLALIQGWFEGDGCINRYNASATSVSRQLVEDFFTIINSCDLSVKIQTRPAYKHTKEHYKCYLDSLATRTLYKIETYKKNYRLKLENKFVTEYGRAAKIKNIEIVDPDTEFVYCIEVEQDHSFICNGFVIHNCSSHAARNAATISLVCDIKARFEAEKYPGRLATEAIYGARGHVSEGMAVIFAMQYLQKSGIALRKKYGPYDLTKYNANIGINWGRTGTPKIVTDETKANTIQDFALITKTSELRDSIYNGYGVDNGSNIGFSAKNRDKNGIIRRNGSWSHSTSFPGMDDTKQRSDQCLFLYLNSWGKNYIGGPLWFGQPGGSFWITEEDAQAILNQKQTYALSNVNGFPAQDIDWSILDEFL